MLAAILLNLTVATSTTETEGVGGTRARGRFYLGADYLKRPEKLQLPEPELDIESMLRELRHRLFVAETMQRADEIRQRNQDDEAALLLVLAQEL